MASTSAARDTSAAKAVALPPSPVMIFAVSSAAAGLRSTQNTCAPSRAKVTAVALPLPQPGPIEPAPTTNAVLSLSRAIASLPCHFFLPMRLPSPTWRLLVKPLNVRSSLLVSHWQPLKSPRSLAPEPARSRGRPFGRTPHAYQSLCPRITVGCPLALRLQPAEQRACKTLHDCRP